MGRTHGPFRRISRGLEAPTNPINFPAAVTPWWTRDGSEKTAQHPHSRTGAIGADITSPNKATAIPSRASVAAALIYPSPRPTIHCESCHLCQQAEIRTLHADRCKCINNQTHRICLELAFEGEFAWTVRKTATQTDRRSVRRFLFAYGRYGRSRQECDYCH